MNLFQLVTDIEKKKNLETDFFFFFNFTDK